MKEMRTLLEALRVMGIILASGTSSSIMNAHKSSLAGILQGFH